MDSSKLIRLSEETISHYTSEVDSGIDDASLTEENAPSPDSSDDDGSVFIVRTVNWPSRRCFPYVFRCESEVEVMLKTWKSAELTVPVPIVNAQNLDLDSHSDRQTVLKASTNPDSESGDDAGFQTETNSDESDSLESVGSDDDGDLETVVTTKIPLLQSIGQKRKQPTTTAAHPFNKFGNHALLQYHFKEGLPPTSVSTVELPHTSDISTNDTPSAPSRRQGRQQLILETQEDRDAYIIMRVTRWQTTGKGGVSGWSDLARRMNTTTLAVRQRWQELSKCNNIPPAKSLTRENFSTKNVSVETPVRAELVHEQNYSLQHKATAPTATTIEVIDLTNAPDVETPPLEPSSVPSSEEIVQVPRLSAELVSYIIGCVHDQTWLLCRRDGLQPLWRQLGVELGLRGRELDALWRQSLGHAYVLKYGHAQIGMYLIVVILYL